MKLTSALLMTLALAANLPLNAIAADSMSKAEMTNMNGMSKAEMADMKTSKAASMSEGEVKKIDKDAGKMAIKHGPLTNLNMPGMTMVFRVKNPAMLEQVKSGDKINFVAENVNGALTVTTLQMNR